MWCVLCGVCVCVCSVVCACACFRAGGVTILGECKRPKKLSRPSFSSLPPLSPHPTPRGALCIAPQASHHLRRCDPPQARCPPLKKSQNNCYHPPSTPIPPSAGRLGCVASAARCGHTTFFLRNRNLPRRLAWVLAKMGSPYIKHTAGAGTHAIYTTHTQTHACHGWGTESSVCASDSGCSRDIQRQSFNAAE